MNIEIEDQVCSLEYAKRLKELGIINDSFFGWFCEVPEYIWCVNKQVNRIGMPAYTAAELGEMLPNRISINEREPFDTFSLYITKFYLVNDDENIISNYIINYECDTTSSTGLDAWVRRKISANIFDKNLANAMAQMLIHLIESKLIHINPGNQPDDKRIQEN